MIAKMTKSRLTLFVAMLLLLMPWWVSSAKLRDERARQAGDSETILRSVRPGEFFGTVLAGSFRAVIIDYLWMRTKILEQRKDYYGLQATYEMLARLQPRDSAILSYNANNMIDNIANRFNTPAMQYKWVARGLGLYRRGIELSPDSIDLRYELAGTFFYKFSYQRVMRASRDFRRRLRDDPNPDYLVFTDRPLRSPMREALYWLNDVLARPQARERKDYHNIQLLRMNCCDVLMFERAVGLREARLDILEAEEAVLAAGADEKERRAAENLLRKRREDLRAIEAGAILAPLSEAELAQVEKWRNESYKAIRHTRLPFETGIKTLAMRRAAVNEIIRSLDEILDMYRAALAAQTPGEAVKKIYDKARIDALDFVKTRELVYGNSFYINPLYEEAFVRLAGFARFDETEKPGGN